MGADGEGHVSIFEVRCVRGDSPQEGDFVTAYDTGFGLMCVGVGSEVVVVVSRRVIWNLFFFFFLCLNPRAGWCIRWVGFTRQH